MELAKEERIVAKMTMQQAIAQAKELSSLFTSVRLLDENAVKGKAAPIFSIGTKTTNLCYELLGKAAPCKECISDICLKTKCSQKKLERFNGKLIRAYARYIEIDGKPYALEMLDDLSLESIIEDDNLTTYTLSADEYFDKLYKDPLTGCYNRRFYDERIQSQKINAGVALLDLDDFKLCNNVFGHNSCDSLLSTIANEIKSCVRATDKLIRYGGDEFLLIIPDIKSALFFDILIAIRNKVNSLEVTGFSGLKATISIGGTCTQGDTIYETVLRADKLMHKAKQQKNQIVTQSTDECTDKENAFKHYVIILDSIAENRTELANILKNNYDILQAESGNQCINYLNKYGNKISLIMLDLNLTDMNGLALLEEIKNHPVSNDIPIIIVTDSDSNVCISRAYEIGIADYLCRPLDVMSVYRRVTNTISMYSSHKRLMARANRQMAERENDMRVMSAILGQIVEFRNCESYSHVTNIRRLTEALLKQLVLKTDKYKLDSDDIVHIVNASALHDIGKIAIDEKIINKPGKLTPEEFDFVKKHTVIGADMLNRLDPELTDPLVKYAFEISRFHHERYDGKGYPDGLSGDQIPISAQVVAICDVYDALREKRVYKPAYSCKKTLEMIYGGECGTFNPLLIECLQELESDLLENESILQNH